MSPLPLQITLELDAIGMRPREKINEGWCREAFFLMLMGEAFIKRYNS